MKLNEAVSWLTGTLQRNLIHLLEECWERPLTGKERQLVSLLELVHTEKFAGRPSQRFGRKRRGRQALARAMVAKAVYNHPHTRATIEALRATPVFRRLCGFVRRCDIPSESVFSRAFAEFAEMCLGEQVHEAMVEKFVKPGLVGHISRDATAIEGREKPVAKLRPLKPAPRKRGRPRRGEVREPKPEPRLQRQVRQAAAEALAELPVYCDVGTKKNSKGYKTTWRGYKLHVDVSDGCLPISVALTAASVHDSQVAIPLMKTTSVRVDYLYDLMDAAFDADPSMRSAAAWGTSPSLIDTPGGRTLSPWPLMRRRATGNAPSRSGSTAA